MSNVKKRIIQAVKRHPCIYDKSLKQYKDPDELIAAWENVSESTGLPANECKDTWTKLRNSLVNAIKRRYRKPTIPKWLYEDEMIFVLPHLCFRSTSMLTADTSADTRHPTPKLERLSPDPESDREATDDPPDVSNEAELDLELSSEANSARIGEAFEPRNEDSNAGSEQNKRTGGSAVAERATDGRRGRGRDAVELFFLSVAAAARRLPRARQVRVRMRVSDAVGAAELRALAADAAAAAATTGAACKRRPHRRKRRRATNVDNDC